MLVYASEGPETYASANPGAKNSRSLGLVWRGDGSPEAEIAEKAEIAVFPAPSDLKKLKKLKITRFCGLLCSCTSPGHGSPEI